MVNQSFVEGLTTPDDETGLYPFMIVATSNQQPLDILYKLLKTEPLQMERVRPIRRHG